MKQAFTVNRNQQITVWGELRAIELRALALQIEQFLTSGQIPDFDRIFGIAARCQAPPVR